MEDEEAMADYFDSATDRAKKRLYTDIWKSVNEKQKQQGAL